MKGLIGILSWLRNFISPFLVFLIIAIVLFYYFEKTTWSLILGIFLVIFGIGLGIYFAEKVRKKYSSESFNAVPMATTVLNICTIMNTK